jgi:hypothetical protein
MAVTLSSTGVTFPDATIQTTAATASAAPGMVLVQTVTASSSATLEVTGFSSTYDNYVLKVTGFRAGTAGTYMKSQLKLGGSYRTGAFYKWGEIYSKQLSGWGIGQYAYLTETEFYMSFSDFSAANNNHLSMDINFDDTNGSLQKGFYGRYFNTGDGAGTPVGVYSFFTGQYTGTGNTSTLDGIKFYMSSGNISSGSFKLYGLRKTV